MDQVEFIQRGAHELTVEEAEELRADVSEFGDVEIARRVGLSRTALARCVARFGVHTGTAALARAYIYRKKQVAGGSGVSG